MQKTLTLLLFFEISLSAFSQADSSGYLPVQTLYSFDWGNNKTSLAVTQFGPSTKTVMIHLHDDETASDKAAEMILRRTGGLLIEVENNGKRLMSFKKSGRIFFFDPNRIFTSVGLKKNLVLLNGRVTSAAISSVKAFAAFILQKIPPSLTSFMALHNNSDGKYSIKSYTATGSRAKDASMVHINPLRDPDNFFILTDTLLFRGLKTADYNVVLVNSKRAVDDGSLSVYFARRKIVYVNVEAQKGRMKTQVNMLQGLMNILPKEITPPRQKK